MTGLQAAKAQRTKQALTAPAWPAWSWAAQTRHRKKCCCWLTLTTPPQLLNYYCSMCCPIGRQNVKPCAVQEFDRVMMQALAALQGTDKISAAIISIAQDGRVDPGEDVQMGEILAYMKNVATAAEAMQLWIKKNLKGEACNGKK